MGLKLNLIWTTEGLIVVLRSENAWRGFKYVWVLHTYTDFIYLDPPKDEFFFSVCTFSGSLNGETTLEHVL